MYDIFIILTWTIGGLAWGSWVGWVSKNFIYAWMHDDEAKWPSWMRTYGGWSDRALVSFFVAPFGVFFAGIFWPLVWPIVSGMGYFYWRREQIRKTRLQEQHSES